MNTKLIRDSYRFEVWLPASLVSWLDARYPEDEPEVAIAKALKALQGRDRRTSERSSLGERVKRFHGKDCSDIVKAFVNYRI